MKEIKNSLAICLAAMVGGWLRYQISFSLAFTGSFPIATLLVNYLGTFILVYLVKGDRAPATSETVIPTARPAAAAAKALET